MSCTCTYTSYAKIGGVIDFDICRYDPECPEHGGPAAYPVTTWNEEGEPEREPAPALGGPGWVNSAAHYARPALHPNETGTDYPDAAYLL